MKTHHRAFAILTVLGAAALQSRAQAQNAKYPEMAPLDQYMMTRDAEIAMARAAAPESISRDAEILVLGRKGYERAVSGKNGFVCIVQRSWTAGSDDPEFWNAKLRAPACFNAAAARSYVPRIFRKTEWVLAGSSKTQMFDQVKAALEKKELVELEAGAMCYMMSRQGYLSDHDGHWLPHLMFFVPSTDAAAWGANLPGSPMIAFVDNVERSTVFLLPVGKWSDGSTALEAK